MKLKNTCIAIIYLAVVNGTVLSHTVVAQELFDYDAYSEIDSLKIEIQNSASMPETMNSLKKRSGHFDHVINRRGESRLTLATGIPFIGVAEYAYGVTDRFTVGILGGLTPAVEGYGVRMRTVLIENTKGERIYFCTPIVYYPKLSGDDPWWLTRPNINFERVSSGNIRYKFGASLIFAASGNSLMGRSAEATLKPAMWTSVHAGMSLPVWNRVSFQTEVSYVTKGLETLKDFVGAPPVILVTGFSVTI